MRYCKYLLKKNILLGYTILLMSAFGTGINGQNGDLKFEHFIDDKGFSQHLVMKVIQDLDGYIWVGTLNGLYKYDGQKFITFKHEINNPNSLVSNSIYELELDASGNILIGTGKGLTKYDRLSQKFETYPLALKNSRVSAICPMSNGDLWVGTSHSGLFYFKSEDTKGENPVQYLHKPNINSSISSNQIHSVVKDAANNIWVGTLKGLNRLMISDGVTQFVRFKEINKSIKAMLVDNDGALLLGTLGHRLLKINTPEKYTKPNLIEYVEYSFDLNHSDTSESGGIITMFKSVDETLFVGIHGYGLYILNERTRNFEKYIHDPRNFESISSNNIESILIDNTSVLWVGTEGGGLNKCDLKQKPIAHFEHNILNKNSLTNSLINCITKEGNNTFWIGTQNGLNHVTFTEPPYQKPVFESLNYGDEINNPQIKSEENIWSVLKDSDGDYWIGGVNRVMRMKRNGLKNTLSFEKTDFNMLEVSSIIEDSKGTLWFGSMINGLIKWPKAKYPNGSFNYSNHTHYLPDDEDRYSISTKEVSCLYQDSKENIWVGTLRGGLNLIVPDDKDGKDQFVAFQNDANNPNSLSHNSVLSILEDRNGVFWIGTYGGGLNKMMLPSNGNSEPIFKHYTEADGLVNNVIYGILEDDQGSLWISTDNGISSFNPETEEFKNFKKEDGLKGNNFRPGAYFKNDDGYLFFGGYKGLNIFNPKALKENDILAPVVFTGLKIKDVAVEIGETYNGRIILDKNLSNISKPITLHYDENTITIDFAALHYAAPEKNQYKYLLEGFNKDWITSKSSNFAHYTNLSPGTYTFKVKASNNDSVWNDEAAILTFRIKPPFWLTWWAYLIYILGLFSIFWGIQSYFRLRSQQRVSEQIQQEIENVNKLKLKFFTNISHEFKTPITLILSPIEELMESFGKNEIVQSKLKIVQRNANSLLRLVNQLMEFRRIEVGETTLSASKANIVSFIKEIALSFQVPAKRKDIVVSFESPLNTLQVWFDWDKLEKIMNNLIYNAIKFTPAGGEIMVKITKSPINQEIEISKRAIRTEFVDISVEDNGIGIDKEKLPYVFQRFYQVNQSQRLPQKGSGIGLALTKDLVDLHYGEINVSSKKGEGSIFKIRLPLGNKHLLPEEILDSQPIKILNEEAVDNEMLIAEEEISNENTNENKSKILVVDDNPDIRLFVKNGLIDKYQILEAENGKEALNITLKHIPDLVITDVLMPEMDGVEFTRKLKTNIRTSHIPIIMLTALNSVEHRINGLEAGADAYIPKPFRMNLLSTRVNKLIVSRDLMKRRFQTEKELTPDYVTLNSVDEMFLKQIMAHMEENMSNEQYWVDELAADMNTSRSTFFRKLKSLTGQAPNDFMRVIRLKRAVQLLEQNELTIAQVSYMVGFRHPNYFGKCFRKFFGVAPSSYVKEKKKEKV